VVDPAPTFSKATNARRTLKTIYLQQKWIKTELKWERLLWRGTTAASKPNAVSILAII